MEFVVFNNIYRTRGKFVEAIDFRSGRNMGSKLSNEGYTQQNIHVFFLFMDRT